MGVKDRIRALNEQAEQNNLSANSRDANSPSSNRSAPIAADEELQNDESVSSAAGGGVEILDGAISTTSSVTTHKLDKKHVQVDVYEDASRESNSIPNVTDAQEHDVKEAPAVSEAVEDPYDEPPMTHVAHTTPDDDVSSLNISMEHNKQSSQLQPLPVHAEEDSFDEYRQKAIQRRNILIILLLLVFLGLVCAIGAGIVVAVKNKPPTNHYEDKYGGVGGGIDTDDLFATAVPSSAPTYEGPCIGVEVGIIFDKYAMETSWKLLVGETEEVIWNSDVYGSNWNNDWDVFRKCFPPGLYTFVFMDKESDGICCNHGEGVYVLSSEGKIIAVGGEMSTEEERTAFELEYVEPEPSDSNGDGLDDRLGLVMPYDSSNLIEGETCENFRLVFETDKYGIETSWELYEGSADRVSENLIANGGPYGSEQTYVYNYCLASPKNYVLYMYDWKGDGLCCGYGDGWYKVTSRDIIIHESNGKFGEEDVIRFLLPAVTTPVPSRRPTPLPTPLPLTRRPTQRPTTSPIISPPAMTDAPIPTPTLRPTLPPTFIDPSSNLQTPPPTPPPFTLPFITFPPTQDTAPISSAPTESLTTISTISPTIPVIPLNVCPFCVGVEMKKPDLALAAGQTCKTVQDKANTLTADHPNCELLRLVEESCCNPG